MVRRAESTREQIQMTLGSRLGCPYLRLRETRREADWPAASELARYQISDS